MGWHISPAQEINHPHLICLMLQRFVLTSNLSEPWLVFQIVMRVDLRGKVIVKVSDIIKCLQASNLPILFIVLPNTSTNSTLKPDGHNYQTHEYNK